METTKIIWTNEDNVCDCYLDVDGGRCVGTKESDLCDCLGLKENCSFYPAKRRQAQFKRMTEKPANPAVTFICPNCDIHLTTTVQVIEGDEETAWLLFKPAYCPNYLCRFHPRPPNILQSRGRIHPTGWQRP